MSSKHHHHHDECCYPMTGYGMSGYGMGGYGGGQVSYAGGGSTWGIRWIYALLILIVIVLQFGRKDCKYPLQTTNACEGEGVGTVGYGKYGFFDNEVIDRSVLFIIVVFLLVLCAGCWWGGQGGYGGYSGGGCGSFY